MYLKKKEILLIKSKINSFFACVILLVNLKEVIILCCSSKYNKNIFFIKL